MDEDGIVAWVRDKLRPTDNTVLLGAGWDDCAHLLAPEETNLLMTTDALVEGVHFKPDDDPGKIGFKTIAATLSDLAASGARARWGVVALTMRKGLPEDWSTKLLEGMRACAERYAFQIVGGDCTSGSGPVNIAVTGVGTALPGGPVSRGSAAPGDVLCVTGQFGGSILGRHLMPTPRLREIAGILQRVTLHGCMDVTDGLALDLHRFLGHSRVGAVLVEEQIPIHPDARRLAAESGRSPLDHALHDGEDFELLFALDPESCEALVAEWPTFSTTALTAIGFVEPGGGVLVTRDDGEPYELPAEGFRHDFA